jgi:hypothetical protein
MMGRLPAAEKIVQFFPYFTGTGPQNAPAGDQDDPQSHYRAGISVFASGIPPQPLQDANDMVGNIPGPTPIPLAEGLPKEPLGSVSLDRVADFSAGNHGPGHVIGGQQVNHEKAPDLFGAMIVDLVKFALFRQ